MALHRSLYFPFPSLHTSPKPSYQTPQFLNLNRPILSLTLPIQKPQLTLKHQIRSTIRATENDAQESETPAITTEQTTVDGGGEELSEIGKEIRNAMKEREKAEESGGGGGGLLSGVVEEIGEIEWPEFRKVVATTGVVLGVTAASTVVLLTVNGVLAEVSDRVFAGKGIQDFFGG